MPWDNLNPDIQSVAPDNAATGPRLGFLSGMEAAYDAGTRTASVDGLAWYFAKADEDQADKARKAGKTYVPLYDQEKPIDPYTNTRSYYGWRSYYQIAQGVVDGTDSWVTDAVKSHDAQVDKLNLEDNSLGLKRMGELFDGVKKSARDAEHRTQLDHSLLGSLGSFVGGAAASLDPRTDIFNTLTLPLGGGKTVVQRVATQAGLQGITETVNQLTGVSENRRLLGLDSSFRQAAGSVLGAVAGGAAFQGAGEAVAAGVRRWRKGYWFENTAADPAPEPPRMPKVNTVQDDTNIRLTREALQREALLTAVEKEQLAREREQTGRQRDLEILDRVWPRQSPLSQSRVGLPRADADLASVRTQLEDWGGPRPHELVPPTETRLPGSAPVDLSYKLNADVGVESLDSIARRIDPELFRAYDKLAQTKADGRASVEGGQTRDKLLAHESVADINDKIDALRAKTETATKRLNKKYIKRIEDLTAERDALLKDATTGDSPEVAAMRERMMQADYSMRDMAPAVTRAYARAQGKWEVYEGQRQQIAKMIRDAGPGIDHLPKSTLPEELPADLFKPRDIKETVPEAAGAKPNETLADTVLRVHGENVKAVDETIAQFQQQVGKAAAGELEHPNLANVEAEKKLLLADEKTKDSPRVAELDEEAKRLAALAKTTITLNVKGKDITLPLDGLHIHMEDADGNAIRMTPREMLEAIENDNNMLKAVSTCSLNATS